MKILMNVVLVILGVLAVSSGISKIMLMPQEVEFFGLYGFTNSLLVIFGFCQLISGVLLLVPKVRMVAAIVVGISFLISAVVLVIAGKVLMSLMTLVSVLLLVVVVKKTLSADNSEINS